jgi:predicted DsbA family dithiol-disulfide isomerase
MVAYGDLNCPFCYALEERLIARDVMHRVEWRLVEHAPALPVELGVALAAEHEELGHELESLLERAPNVRIARPPFRPNSGRAIQAVAEACALDPLRAWALRLSLFRALWREGRNIADPQVISALVERAGLPPLQGTAAAAAVAARWTREWHDARYERIPVMISDVNTKLLGLVPLRRLELFLASGLFSGSSELVCEADGKGK